MSEISDLLIWK